MIKIVKLFTYNKSVVHVIQYNSLKEYIVKLQDLINGIKEVGREEVIDISSDLEYFKKIELLNLIENKLESANYHSLINLIMFPIKKLSKKKIYKCLKQIIENI
jgi:hypothetical protein